MTYSLVSPAAGTVDLGTVRKETVTESSQLNEFAMPLSASSSTNVFDYMGVVRKVMIEGKKDAATGDVADLTAFATKIHQLQNGNQSRSTFQSTIHGTLYVKVNDTTMTFDDQEGPSLLGYSINMTESADV